MCQSKAEGGLRCSSHAVDALYNHADKQIALVKEYAQEHGLKLPEESKLYNSFENFNAVHNKAQQKSAYKKASNAMVDSAKECEDAETKLAAVAGFRNPSSVAAFLWERNPEAKAARDLRDKAFDSGDDAEAQKQIAKLKGLRAKTTAEAEYIVKAVGNGGQRKLMQTLNAEEKAPAYLVALQDKHENAKEEYLRTRNKLVGIEKERFISRKLRSSEEYTAISKKIDFRKRPASREWEAREKELQKEYSMTGEYRQKMEDLASFHQVGSPEREAIESKMRQVEILKKLTVSRNMAQAAKASGSKEPVSV